jgi:hypothetical protein
MKNKKYLLLIAVALFTLAAVGQATYTVYRAIHIYASLIDSTPLGSVTPSTVNATTLALNGAAPSGHTLCGNGTSYIDCAATPQTCNSNGCYTISGDGTINQWGQSGSCGSGTNSCSVAVTFPTAFTSTSNLVVTVSTQENVSGATGNTFSMVNGSPTISGFNAYFAALVYVGGSGNNLSGSQTVYWRAVGH